MKANQDPTSTLYAALYSGIAQKFSPILVNPQVPLQLQFPLSPMVANWTGGSYPAYDAFAVGDDAPMNHGLLYLPDAGQSIYSQYGLWVNGLLTPNRATDPTYKNLAMQSAKLASTINNQYNQLSNNFTLWKGGTSYDPSVTTVTQYIQSMYSGSLGVQYGTNLTTEAGITLQMKEYIAKADPILAQAVTSYGAKTSTTTYIVPPPTGTTTAGVLTIGQGGANLSTDLANWQLGNYGAQGFGPVPLSMGTIPVYSQQTVTVTVYESNSYFFGLFSDSSSTSYTVTQNITTYTGFELDVQLSAMVAYPISRGEPGGWFSLSAVGEYDDSPLVGGLTTAQFFDPQVGSLALIPAYVIVGFNPTLKLTMATSAYNQYADAINKTGMKIGPFIVGGNTSQPATILSSDPNQTVVQFATPTGNLQDVKPYIMGMIHYATASSTLQLKTLDHGHPVHSALHLRTQR